MAINYGGFNKNVLTFRNSNAKVGAPVCISSADTVSNAPLNDTFIGICIGADENYASVQITGYAEVKCFNDGIMYGPNYVKSNGNGGINIAADSSKVVTVVKIDKANSIIGIIL